MVFQQYSSFPWMSVLDNVKLPLILRGVSDKEATERAMEMIKIVGHETKWGHREDSFNEFQWREPWLQITKFFC